METASTLSFSMKSLICFSSDLMSLDQKPLTRVTSGAYSVSQSAGKRAGRARHMTRRLRLVGRPKHLFERQSCRTGGTCTGARQFLVAVVAQDARDVGMLSDESHLVSARRMVPVLTGGLWSQGSRVRACARCRV